MVSITSLRLTTLAIHICTLSSRLEASSCTKTRHRILSSRSGQEERAKHQPLRNNSRLSSTLGRQTKLECPLLPPQVWGLKTMERSRCPGAVPDSSRRPKKVSGGHSLRRIRLSAGGMTWPQPNLKSSPKMKKMTTYMRIRSNITQLLDGIRKRSRIRSVLALISKGFKDRR